MVYHCNECGEFFEEEFIETWYEKRGDYREEVSGCPFCGGGSMTEAKECKLCGDYIAEGECCEMCKRTLMRKFRTMFENEFTEEEKEILRNLYNNGWELIE